MSNLRVNPISSTHPTQKYPYPKYMDRVQGAKDEESFREQLKNKIQQNDKEKKKNEYRKTHDTVEISHKER